MGKREELCGWMSQRGKIFVFFPKNALLMASTTEMALNNHMDK